MPSDAGSSSSGSSDTEEEWTENEGESTDNDEETPADPSLRGQAALITASCPRKYPKELAARRARRVMLPDDFTTEEFLKKFRRVFNANSNVNIEKATCHDEPHKRLKKSSRRRERHKHLAIKTSANFAHRKIAAAFYKEHGVRISFSFRLRRFVGNLAYLMQSGKKPSTDLDLQPAKFPACLDLQKELDAHKDPRETEDKERKKRQRLTFDEVSNLIIDGVGDGQPLKTGKELEAAAKKLKTDGKVELWNYVGEFKCVKDVSALVSKVWRMHGSLEHPFFHKTSEYKVSQFNIDPLKKVRAWRAGGYKSRVLVLSGDGGLGKTALGEALAMEVGTRGFWFVDDPDDFRELEGLIETGDAIVVDEIAFPDVPVNQVKKLFDTKKRRRVKCRFFNGSIPEGCSKIFCTNSGKEQFYPHFPCKNDRTGVMRRHFFEEVEADLRKMGTQDSIATSSAVGASSTDVDLQQHLQDVMMKARVGQHTEAAVQIAMDLGAALRSELPEIAHKIARGVGMKPLEQQRFLEHCGCGPVLKTATPDLPYDWDDPTCDDEFPDGL